MNYQTKNKCITNYKIIFKFHHYNLKTTMQKFVEQNRYLIYGASAIAVLGGLYYMTREDEELAQVLDPQVHTLPKLRQIMDEIFIESATLYCQKIRLIRDMKRNGEFKGKESIETLLEKQ